MARESITNEFGLEELEPRVLLSVNIVGFGAVGAVAQIQHNQLAVVPQSAAAGSESQGTLSYQSSIQATDVFAGVSESSQPITAAVTSAPAPAASEPAVATNPSATTSAIAAPAATVPNVAPLPPGNSPVSNTASTASGAISTTQQLTDTLKVANAPPVQTSATAQLLPAPAASPVNLGSDDLATFVDDVLAGATSPENGTYTLSSLTIGNFAELRNVVLKFNNAVLNENGNGPVSYQGSVQIYFQSNGSGVLFPGSTFSGTFSGSTSPSSPAGTFNLQSGLVTFQATGLKLPIANALNISASSASFSYQYVNANGGYSNVTPDPTQIVTTITGAIATSVEFPGLSSATLANFQIRNNGFSFNGFSLTSAPGAVINFDGTAVGLGVGLFSAGGSAGPVSLNVSPFNVTFATSPNGQPSMAGSTIALTLPGFQLYPGGNLVQLQYSSINAFYDFSGFDGVNPTGALTIAVNGFQMNFGQALQLSSANPVTLKPEQFNFANIASAELSSPIFSNLTSDAASNLALSYSGVSLGTFSIQNTTSPVKIGNNLSFTTAEVDFTDFGLTYSQSTTGSSTMTGAIQGQVAVVTSGAVLFPGVAFVNTNLGGLAGTFNDPVSQTWTGVLSLVVPSFVIPLGDALTLNLGANVLLQPGNYIMVQPASATVTPNLFSGVSGTLLSGFQITQDGFTLGSFTLSGTGAMIGNYLSFNSVTIQVNQFTLGNATQTPAISGSILVTVGGTRLYPGDPSAVFTDTSVSAAYDFASPASLGRLTLDVAGFTLAINSELKVTDNSDLIITPSQNTLATLASAGLDLMTLNNLSATVMNVALMQTGFTLNSANGSSAVPDVEVGDALQMDSTQLSFSDSSPVKYLFGSTASGESLSGDLMLASAQSDFDLGMSPQGNPIDTASSTLSGAFNLAQKSLNVTMNDFQVNLPSFVDIGNASALISFQISPTTNLPVFHVGISGVNLFLGSGTSANMVGINISNATLAAAVFPGAANGNPAYALQATGTLSLVGFSSDALTLTGSTNAIVRYSNTNGPVNETVNVDSNPDNAITLAFQGSETSVAASSFSLSIGMFATAKGDFGFSVVTDPATGNVQAIAVAVDNASVALDSSFQGIGGVGLSLAGTAAVPMQVSLLILPGAMPTYVLASTGGNIAIDGIPEITIVGSNLRVVVNTTNQDPTTLPGGSQTIITPDGGVTLNFAGVGAGNVFDLQGSITELQVGDILDATGDFGFQAFTTPSGGSAVIIAAENVTAVMGTPAVNLTIENASLGLLIVPGTSPAYALVSNGGNDSLNGINGLTLTASSLKVNINSGVDAPTLAAASEAVQTPDGSLALNFNTLSAAPSADIQGMITLKIDNFTSLTSSFGFQAVSDPATGLTDIVAGATGINFTLGTNQTNLAITGASFAVVIVPLSTGGSAWGLISNGGMDSLNGVTGLMLTATNLQVEVSRSLTPDMLDALPDSVQTPGGGVPLNFANLDSGDITAVEGQVMLNLNNFVTVNGDFGFQAFSETPGGPSEILVGAQSVNALLGNGSVAVNIEQASLALLIQPNSGGFALVANGGNDSLTGINGLTLMAMNLVVKFNNTGIDPTTLNASAQSVITPDGEINLNDLFAGLGSQNTASIQGTLTLQISNFVSVTGNFGLQLVSDPNTNGTDILAAADQVFATLGTSETYVSIQGASLGLLIVPGASGGATTYALVANGGNDSLEGVDGLTFTAGSLAVMFNNTGEDPATVVAANTMVPTSDMQVNVGAIFSGVGAAAISSVQGSLTLDVRNFASVSGSFSFTETSGTGGVSKLLIGANNVNAFVGTTDSMGNPMTGVQISNAQLGLVIYLGDEPTFALYTSAQITPVGLTSDNITLTGTVSFSVNTTGGAVNETVNTPGGSVQIAFTDGTNGTPNQSDYLAFGGSFTATFQTNTTPITLMGSFTFAKTTDPGTGDTVLLIGASGVSATGITADNGTMVNITNGMLGVAIYPSGYALTASATVSGSGSGGSASGTITLRRNTTTIAVMQPIQVGAATVQDVFSSTEVSTNGTPFQSFALSNVNVSVDNTLLFVADSISTSNPGPGISLQSATGATLTLQDPNTMTAVFSITAGSATYATLSPNANYDNMVWTNGGTDVMLQNISFSLGSNVNFSATSVTIQHYMGTSGEVNAFNFTGATVALSIGGQNLVTITGSVAFTYSSQNGFTLNTANGPPTLGYSFFNTSATGGANGAGTGGGGNGPVPAGGGGGTMLGPIMMSSPVITLTNFSFKLVSGQPTSAQLGVTVTITVPSASISATVAGLSMSASLTNLSGSFNLNATVNLANLMAAPTLTASGFTIMAQNLSITIGPYQTLSASLTLSANNVTLNPTADDSQPLVAFGGTQAAPGLQATLTIGAITLSGGAGNFTITGDGSFVAGNNFFVIFSLGQNQNPSASTLGWPSWLPLQSATIALTWPNNNFNSAPGSFLIDLSASIALNNIQGVPLALNGTITNAVIDTNLVGKSFPIISIQSLSVTVTGNLFGCAINGTLIAGVVRFDSTGRTVDGYGNLVSTGQPDTGPFTSVFYAGINAGITIAGIGGFNVKIGLSQYGPLDIYFSLTLPTGLILDPQSGLAINNFRGGVTFSGLPSPLSSTPVGTDALNLNQAAFTAPAALTAQQWQTQMEGAVAAQYLQSISGGVQNSWTNLTGPVTIKAGVTFYDAYATESTFRVDGDIFFDTTGKFLVIGTATFLDSVSVTVRFYADLSTLVGQQSPPSLTILFLMNMPDVQAPATSPLQIYGLLSFNFTRTDNTQVTFNNPANQIQIVLSGGAILNVQNQLQATLTGTVKLSFAVTSSGATMQLDVNASLNVTNLGNLASVGGALTFQINPDGTADLWGALLLTTNFNTQAFTNPALNGLSFKGTAYFEINTSAQAQTVTVMVGSNPATTLTLQPQLFSVYLNGAATFTVNNQQPFTLSGTLAVAISSGSATVFVQAVLQVGPPGTPLFSFIANGLMYIDSTGFAAMITLSFQSSSVPGITFNANALLLVNTTLRTITYTIPSPPPTSPPTPAVQTVMGPDFSSSNPLATTSYEGAGRTLIIPSAAPPTNQNPASWNVTGTNAYFVILVRGKLMITANGSGLTLTGALSIVATFDPNSGALSFSLMANAALNLDISGNTVFSFNVQASLLINNNGLVAYLGLQLGSSASNLAFSFAGGVNLSFTLQINTTGVAAPLTLPGGAMPTVQPGVSITVAGLLQVAGISINGTFALSIKNNVLLVSVSGQVSVLGLTLNVQGFAGVYDDANPGIAFSLALTLGNGNTPEFNPAGLTSSVIDISGSLLLQINTSSVSRAIYDVNGNATGQTINPGALVQVTNLKLYLLGFNLTGSLTITLTPNGYSINIPSGAPLMLNFFNIVTLSLSGNLTTIGNSTTFNFTAGAAITLGTPSFGLRGNVAVTFSNTGMFSAQINGEVTAFGISVQAGASVAIDTSNNVTLSVYVSATLFPAVNIDFDGPNVPFVGNVPSIHIHTPAVTVSGTAEFALGKLAPPPVPQPPPPVIATLNGGVLVLNFGANVGNRIYQGFYGPQPTEQYNLKLVAGNSTVPGSQSIMVTALGYSMSFDNVTSILVTNTASSATPGNAIIQISSQITVPLTITLGGGNNIITTGGGLATVTVSGNGNNIITAPGGANITVNGAGNNNITLGGPAGSNIIIAGNGNNSIITGSGFAAITDNGFGSNSIEVGTGSGSYNENPLGPFLDPQPQRKTTITGNVADFSVAVSGYGYYQLSNTDLLYAPGGVTYTYDLQLGGITQVMLTTNATVASKVLLSGWTGSATIIGNQQNATTVSVTPGLNVTNPVVYVLTDDLLTMTVGSASPVLTTLQNVQNVNLVGGAGVNSFDVSGWHGGGGLTGSPVTNASNSPVDNSVNTVIADDDASFVLTDSSLSRYDSTDGMTFQALQLNNINVAKLTGGAGVNTFQVGTPGVFSAGNPGSAWSGQATLNGSGGNDIYDLYFNGMNGAAVTVQDNTAGAQDTLNLYASRTITVTPNIIKVLAQRVFYGNAQGNNGGVATLDIIGEPSPAVSHLRYKVVGTNSATDTTIDMTGTASANLFIGARAGMVLPNLSFVQGPLTILDDGTDTISVTDATGVGLTGVLTSTRLSGLGMGPAGVIYSDGLGHGPMSLTIILPAAGNNLSVAGTNANTSTTVTLGGSHNNINVGTDGPLNDGSLAGIQGTLTLNGSGASVAGDGTDDVLNITNEGSVLAGTGGLTNTTVHGFGMGPGGIIFNKFAAVNVNLGSGGNVFAINTFPGMIPLPNPGQIVPLQLVALYTAFTINGGTGGDEFNVLSTIGPTFINTGGVNPSTVNVGSNSPGAGGRVDFLLGVLTVNGQGFDTMNVDDTGSTIGKTGELTATQLTGLGATGLVPQIFEVMFSTDLSNWSVAATFASTSVITVWNDPNTATLPQGFYRVFQLVSGGSPVELTPTIRIVNQHVQLTWVNDGAIDAGIVIKYSGLSDLNINLGSGDNEFQVSSTAAGTDTVIRSGNGDSVINVQATTGPTTLITGVGTQNDINVGSLAPDLGNGGVTDDIQGALNIVGRGSDNLFVDDSGNDIVRTGTLTDTSLTGLGMGPEGIQFSGLNGPPFIHFGSGDTLINNSILMASTIAGSSNQAEAGNVASGTGDGGSAIALPVNSSNQQTAYYPALFQQSRMASGLGTDSFLGPPGEMDWALGLPLTGTAGFSSDEGSAVPDYLSKHRSGFLISIQPEESIVDPSFFAPW
jgi:hypothetical protein